MPIMKGVNPMKLTFELMPDLATQLAPCHQFNLSVVKDGEEIQDSRGSDTYAYHAMVLPGRPIAATGRDAIHNFEPDLKGINGIAGTPVEVSIEGIEDLEGLIVRLDNNFILAPEILQSYYSLRCQVGEKVITVPLKSHFCRVNWKGLGTFEIEAGALCRDFLRDMEAEI